MSAISLGAQGRGAGHYRANSAGKRKDRATQQNAATVEETTAAAGGPAQETEELTQLLDRFDTDETAQPAKQRAALEEASRLPADHESDRGAVSPAPKL